MKEKITKAEFINTWASEWDEITGWKVSEKYHNQLSEQLEPLINQEVEKRIAETVAGKFIAVEIEKRIADRFPSKEKILKYFNNHFDCYADVIIGLYETTEVAMTESAVLKMFEWLLSCLTCSEKPNNSQKTEGGAK